MRKYLPPLSPIWIDCLPFYCLRLQTSGMKPMIQTSTLGERRPLFRRARNLMLFPVSMIGGAHACMDQGFLLDSSSIVVMIIHLCMCSSHVTSLHSAHTYVRLRCSHGGSRGDFHALPLIDARVGETLLNHSSEGSSCDQFLALNHGQHNYPMTAEYPDSDTPTTPSTNGSSYSLPVHDSSFTTPSPISPEEFFFIGDGLWHHPWSSHSADFEESSTAGDLTHESTQNDWTTPSFDIHAPPAQFIQFLPPPSVPLPLPMQLGGQDLLNEDQASDEAIFVQEHEMYCCPLLTSNGMRCGTFVPCEEAPLTAHLRGVHGLRAKRLEVIDCPWPGCDKRNQAASIPRHIITLHVKKRVQCSYCGKSLTRKDGKAKHEKICPENPINATRLSFM